MKIATNGIVVNQFGQVLLIRRDDTRTWAIPGGALEAGELPTDGAAREVEEETGLKVLPVRLVGLYYWSAGSDDMLLFCFRCLVRGGRLTPSEESPQVGFVPPEPLPRPMLNFHRERLVRGLRHQGGPPDWGRQKPSPLLLIGWRFLLGPLIYSHKALRRRWLGQPRYQPPPSWGVGAFVVIRDPAGRVLWVRRHDYDVWNLPGGRGEPGETPWKTAVRDAREETGLDVRLTDLSGVYVKPTENRMLLTFTAEVVGGELTANEEAAEFTTFMPGEEPANSLPKHVERVADATGRRQKTLFRRQEGPSGLEALGLKSA